MTSAPRMIPAVSLASIPVALLLYAQDARAGQEVDVQSGIDDIIVTATRRSERLIDVPQAITALSGETLARNSVRSFADYARLVPGLSFEDLGAGRARPAIRGVNVNTGAAPVGTYIDESPIPSGAGVLRLTTIDPNLFDIERIEVLRGPQGTLFGGDSMAGAIRIITRAPDSSDAEGAVRLIGDSTSGGGLGGSADFMINLPIVADKVALRGVGWVRGREGFITRQVEGTDRGKVAEEDIRGVRLALGVTEGAVRLVLGVMHEEQSFTGFQNVTFGPANPDRRLVQNMRFDIDEPNRNRFTLTNLLAEVDLGAATLTSVSTGYFGNSLVTEDAAEVQLRFLGQAFPNPVTEDTDFRALTQEIRLASNQPLAGFDYTIGAFYNATRSRRAFDWQVPQFVPTLGTGNLFTGLYTTNTEQKALFGEIRFRPTSLISLTAGARIYDASGNSIQQSDGVFNGGPTLDLLAYGKSGVAGKFAVSIQPGRDVLVYAQAAQGFRPGFGRFPLPPQCAADVSALNLDASRQQVDPDTLWNYEIGAKAASADGKLRGAIATYQIDWSDIQLGVFLPCGFNFASNAGRARIRGFEFEGSFAVTGGLSLGTSLSYTDSEFREVKQGAVASVGDPVLQVPRWQGGAYVQHDFELGADTRAYARLDIQYTGDSLLFYTTDPAVAPAPLEFRRKPALTLVNARVQLDRRNWTFAMFGRNLLDQVEPAGFADALTLNTPTRPRLAVNRPRTVGVEVERRF